MILVWLYTNVWLVLYTMVYTMQSQVMGFEPKTTKTLKQMSFTCVTVCLKPGSYMYFLRMRLRNECWRHKLCSTLLRIWQQKRSCDVKFTSNSHCVCIRSKYEKGLTPAPNENTIIGCLVDLVILVGGIPEFPSVQ